MEQTSKIKVAAAYGFMLAGAAGAFLAIRRAGEHLANSSVQTKMDGVPPVSAPVTDTLLHVLLAIAIIITVTRAVGLLFKRMGQPLVIGEVAGGILLGPSLLGQVAPEATAYILPPSVAPFLGMIAQLGVILYMFVVGMELDLRAVRNNSHTTIAISHASIIVPFVLGALLSLALFREMAPAGVPFTVFALFIGVSMSITAFPVLARILTDRHVHKTRLGTTALTCAAVDDATAWCMLAFVVSIAQSRLSDAIATLVLTVAFVAVVLIAVVPIVRRAMPFIEKSAEGGLAVVLVAMLLCALATEYIGIHAIFGAFLLGAAVPHESRIARELTERLAPIVSVLFLPAFFAFTGMRTQIGLIGGWENWLLCGLIIAVACAGKFGGTFVAARLTGLPWRGAGALGILMNTRGLVELIVLNIGLDLGVISPTLFAMLVIMALCTTVMTTPLLDIIMGGRSWDSEMSPQDTHAHEARQSGNTR